MRDRINWAKRVLDLSDVESISSLKKKFRTKFKSSENKKDIVAAYRFIVSLMEEHPIALDELLEKRAEERLKRRFNKDWLTGREG